MREEFIIREMSKFRKIINIHSYIRKKYNELYLQMEKQYMGNWYCPYCGNINIGRVKIFHTMKPMEDKDECKYDIIINGTKHKRLVEMIDTSMDFNDRQYKAAREISIINYKEMKEEGIDIKRIVKRIFKGTIEERKEILKLTNSYHILQQMKYKQVYEINEYMVGIGTRYIPIYQAQRLRNGEWKTEEHEDGY
jgi:hypothetical protein